ncbi:hypothetical protein BHAOGJBA_4210 [Methylobacterium hispanicum]|uniref:Uncharacterized protein n=1 Tax=Methylobacterium hispanicum TaxID=270350 RepID=A0AAV4ZQX3_9HYPH|nr:hypothetical protein [Methylobacterium hispanicum]GJD90668.1 hypothetical protein BHAOGJBA_4210 [Methylobacterium hispanicum]
MTDLVDLLRQNLVQPLGYKGSFIRHQAQGAIPNGRRIYKRSSDRGDTTPDGTILGSFDAGDAVGVGGINYFVAWDRDPLMPILLPNRKVSEEIPTAHDEPSAPSAPRC